MSCTECKYAPKTYGEYCMAQSNQKEYCLDAFTGKSSLCELYTDTKGAFDDDKKKFLELINDYYRAGCKDALEWVQEVIKLNMPPGVQFKDINACIDVKLRQLSESEG